MRRNQVYGAGTGIFLADNLSAVVLRNDIVAGSAGFGLTLFDDASGGNGDAVAKNLTLVNGGGGSDVSISGTDADLVLDSSIVAGNGITAGAANTCLITNSRGPTTTPGGNGCLHFQTSQTPSFVNAGANDFRLTGSNPVLIDNGDLAAPIPPDDVDFEGDKRAIDGDGSCTEERDMGADEFVPPAPTAAFTGGPANASTINAGTTSFTFTNSNTCPGAGFECKLDAAAFTACSSPANLSGLGEGSHTFSVRALDLVPQSGPVNSRTFTVDLPDAGPVPTPTPTPTAPAKKHCKKGQKLKKGKCVKKKRKR
jgi:hypothetical protein